MKSYLEELQLDLSGMVTDNAAVLEHFSTDASIFTLRPDGIMYPQNTKDVQVAVKFVAEKAAAGKKLSLTARGLGNDLSGAALSNSLIIEFPAHMNQLLKFDKKLVTVQPGLNYGALQQILASHGRTVRTSPCSQQISSLGGVIGNDAADAKSLKYGSLRQFVTRLQVILSDGSLVETKRLSARSVAAKKRLSTLEGDIYRTLDGLLKTEAQKINAARPQTPLNTAGYNLWDIRRPDGSMDLTQLIIGSQGTLGIVTEITLKTVPSWTKNTLLAGFFDNMDALSQAVAAFLPSQPSMLELVDRTALEIAHKQRPGWLAGILPDQAPQFMVLIEFDDVSQLKQNLKSRQVLQVIKKHGSGSYAPRRTVDQLKLRQILQSAATLSRIGEGTKSGLSAIEDAVVPITQLTQFWAGTSALTKRYGLQIGLTGHIGIGNFRIFPNMSLSKAKDRTKLLELANEFYELVIRLGGSTSASHNDGLQRSQYLKALYGDEIYELFKQVKQLFDPHNIFNPNIKTGINPKTAQKLLRHEYSPKQLFDHLL